MARPCAYTHICPAGLFEHPRNKTDAQLRELVESVGVAAYAPFMRRGAESNLDDVVDMYDHVIDICREANVGIGTDFTEGLDTAFFDWIRKDKGYGHRMVPSQGTAPVVAGFETLATYPALTATMLRRWPKSRVRAVWGENWLSFLDRVW